MFSRNHSYQVEWEEDEDCEGWLTRSEYGARCSVCNKELMCKLPELKRHSKTQQHIKAMTGLWDKQGLGKEIRDDLKPAFQPWQLPEVKKREFELKLALITALEMEFRGARDLCKVMEEKLQRINFSMSGSETRVLFNAVIAPHYKEVLMKDMRDAHFSIILDDADSNLVRPNKISVLAYYYSRSQEKTVCTYLGMARVDPDSPEDLVESLVQLMVEWELYGYNMVALNTDGIAGLCPKVIEELIDQLRPTCPNMIHLQSTFQAIASALHRAVKKHLPQSLEFVLRGSYNWFAENRERQLKYSEVIDEIGFREMTSFKKDESEWLNPILPSSSQWLDIAEFTSSFYMNYNSLCTHFEIIRDKESCYIAQILSTELNSIYNRAYFNLLQPILTELAQIKGFFENSTENNVERVEQLEVFFLAIASQILNADIMNDKTVQDICKFELDSKDIDCLLPIDDINYGPNFVNVLESCSLSEEQKVEVKMISAQMLKTFFQGLQIALKDALACMRSASHFTLPGFLSSPLEKKHLVTPFFEQDEKSLKDLLSKYNLMKMLDWKNKKSTLLFWQELHDFGDSSGNFPFRVLTNGVWKMFCVPLFCLEVQDIFREINQTRKRCQEQSREFDLTEEIIITRMGLRALGKSSGQFQPPAELIKF